MFNNLVGRTGKQKAKTNLSWAATRAPISIRWQQSVADECPCVGGRINLYYHNLIPLQMVQMCYGDFVTKHVDTVYSFKN